MQLIYPWFLVGIVAVAIPLIIHLLQLRRPQRLLFTNTAFIRAVELVTVQHRRVQHLLILLARALALMALVFAFCQPFVPAEQHVPVPAVSGANVLVDNSFSMQLQDVEQGSLFREAVAEAKLLGQSVPATAKLRLLNNGGRGMNHAAYQAKLDELKITARTFALKAFSAATNQNLARTSLYVFSDFQKTAFNAKTLNELDAGQAVVLVPLVGQQAGNVYVDSVWLDDAFVRVRTNVGMHVRLRNGGSLTSRECPVKVFLGARQVAAFRVTVGAGQAVSSVVQVQVSDRGLALGRVVTEDGPVTFDNTYYFTLQPAATIRVLEIGPEPVAEQLYGNEPLFSYAFANPQGVDYGVMRRANLVLVREVSEITAGLRDGLHAVVKRGGSVVVVPSALSAGRESYQRLFRELGLGTVQWETANAAPELRDVAMPNVREPFFRDVFGAQQQAVTMPRVSPVLHWSRTGTDILRLRDGESYLADFTSGTGRVYVFSAPFAKAYADFVAHALFVPVMYRMAMLSYRQEQLPAYRLTQGTVNLKLPLASEAATGATGQADKAGLRFVKDSLTFIPAQRAVGQEVRLEVPMSMDVPGFYQVQRGDNVLTTLAFNQDKRESELAAYSANGLRQLIGPNRPNIRVLDGGTTGASLTEFRAAQTGQPLWRYFLVVALICLLAEALLVRFGGWQAGAKKGKLAV